MENKYLGAFIVILFVSSCSFETMKYIKSDTKSNFYIYPISDFSENKLIAYDSFYVKKDSLNWGSIVIDYDVYTFKNNGSVTVYDNLDTWPLDTAVLRSYGYFQGRYLVDKNIIKMEFLRIRSWRLEHLIKEGVVKPGKIIITKAYLINRKGAKISGVNSLNKELILNPAE